MPVESVTCVRRHAPGFGTLVDQIGYSLGRTADASGDRFPAGRTGYPGISPWNVLVPVGV